jgi:hypothetical protein
VVGGGLYGPVVPRSRQSPRTEEQGGRCRQGRRGGGDEEKKTNPKRYAGKVTSLVSISVPAVPFVNPSFCLIGLAQRSI